MKAMKAANPRKTMAIGEASPLAEPSLLSAAVVPLVPCDPAEVVLLVDGRAIEILAIVKVILIAGISLTGGAG